MSETTSRCLKQCCLYVPILVYIALTIKKRAKQYLGIGMCLAWNWIDFQKRNSYYGSSKIFNIFMILFLCWDVQWSSSYIPVIPYLLSHYRWRMDINITSLSFILANFQWRNSFILPSKILLMVDDKFSLILLEFIYFASYFAWSFYFILLFILNNYFLLILLHG